MDLFKTKCKQKYINHIQNMLIQIYRKLQQILKKPQKIYETSEE